MVVDLYPVDRADGRDPDHAAAVGELLEAVFVVQRGIPAPGRLEGGRQRRRGLRADQRIATEGRVAVAVGPSQGDSVLADLAPEHLGAAEVFRVEDGTVDSAVSLGKQLRADSYEAVAGIGGGKTIDVTKFAAHMAGIPMVAVATNLSHDGIASPVSSLEHESGKGSYGVVPPVAVVVDLDRVRSGPLRLVRAGIGDVVNNLSAIADWELAAADCGEPVDGLAVTLARTAAQAVLHEPGSVADDEFLTVLAESLVLSGIAMTVAGSSRPSSGGDHEILHAIDQLFPGAGTHGELAGVGALFCTFLRGDDRLRTLMSACLARHGLPRTPADLGLSHAEFTKAVLHAPATRPGRYTILERLALDECAIARRVEDFAVTIESGE